MRRRVLINGVLAGMIVFGWSMLSWMVLPWHKNTIHPFEAPEILLSALQQAAPVSGIYTEPDMNTGEPSTHGPLVFTSVNHAGGKPMALSMGAGLLLQCFAGILACWLLSRTKFNTFFGRFSFTLILTLFAGLVGYLPYWIWWGFPLTYVVIGITDLLISWGLASLVLARNIEWSN